MLTPRENLQLIQQAEKSNLSEIDGDKLIKWANIVRTSSLLLDSVFKGHLDVVGMDNMLPDVVLTSEGAKSIIGEV